MSIRPWIGVVFVLVCTAAYGEPPKPAVVPFDLADVKLLDGPIKDRQELNRKYLLSLDPDRLLHVFRVNAGIASSAKPLGGWESPDCELRGHFVGHYLSACALMYQSTGDPQIKANADKVVAGLAQCQAELGNDGYLSAFPATYFERLEAGKPVWAPYYTIHKIMAGLLDVNQAWGNKTALDVDVRMARYFAGRMGKLNDAGKRVVWKNEFGGMMEVAENLFGVTHDPVMLELAEDFDQPSFFDPLAAGDDKLKGLHANTHIPKVIGAARKYEITGGDRDRKIATYFWDEVTKHRAFATGGTSTGEFWRTPPDVLAHELTTNTAESCCTYNMLKLTDHLFQWDPKPEYADYYERAWWNSVLPVQQPGTGMLEYYQSLEPNTPKVFGDPTDSFWCCYGTGVESFSKLAGAIYYHDDDRLFVNQFVPSEVVWKAKGITIRQETKFPTEGSSKLTIHVAIPTKMNLQIRVPVWCEGDHVDICDKSGKFGVSDLAEQTTVGAPIATSSTSAHEPMPQEFWKSAKDGGGFKSFDRIWSDGDQVRIEMPVHTWGEPMPDDRSEVAVMYGPLVLAADMGDARPRHRKDTELMTEAGTHALPALIVDKDGVPAITVKDGHFAATTADGPIELIPLYRLFGRNYTVYFKTTTADGAYAKQYKDAAATVAAMRARVIDEVLPDDAESETAHNLKSEKSSAGEYAGGHWRHAPGGWFSWDLAVDPEKSNALVCKYWGDDAGRTFDILIDGKKIATQTLNKDKPGEFWTAEYPIPAESTKGKHQVTVRFEAAPDSNAGGIFGCGILKAP